LQVFSKQAMFDVGREGVAVFWHRRDTAVSAVPYAFGVNSTKHGRDARVTNDRTKKTVTLWPGTWPLLLAGRGEVRIGIHGFGFTRRSRRLFKPLNPKPLSVKFRARCRIIPPRGHGMGKVPAAFGSWRHCREFDANIGLLPALLAGEFPHKQPR
jgi:hypothetical protein